MIEKNNQGYDSNNETNQISRIMALIEEKEKELNKIIIDLEIEKKASNNFVKLADDRATLLRSLVEIITIELNEEERILRSYELLEDKNTILNKKYNSMVKSYLGRVTLFSWDIYNKIRYNKSIKEKVIERPTH